MAEKAVELESLLARWEEEVSLEDQLRALGGDSDPHQWVSLAEAEHQAGVSRSTLRAWYRGGQIASRLVPGPHGMQRLVPLDAVLERVARSPRSSPASAAAAVSPASPASSASSPAREEGPMNWPPPAPPSSDVVRLAEMAVQEARDRATAAERRAEAAEQLLREAIERAASAEAALRAHREG